MIDKLTNAFQFQQQALSLLNKRQEILASNIANADTPGYQARDIDFNKLLKNALSQQSSQRQGLQLSLTSGHHIAAQGKAITDNRVLYRVPDQPSADGNTVDMDRERINFVDNNIKYQSGLSFLSSQIKGMNSVLNQG